MDFSQIIKSLIDQNMRIAYHYGEVTAITNDSGTYYLSVKPSGSTTAITKVRYLRSYVPRVGDTVLLQVNKSDLLVLGALAAANKTLAPTASRSTNQTITTSTQTKISFDAVDSDDWNCWDLSPNPTRLTVPIAGRYLITATASFEAAAAGHRAINILKNNTTEIARSDFLPVGNSIDTHSTVVTPSETLAAGDYIELRAWQNSGSDLDILGAGDHFPTLSLIYLGP